METLRSLCEALLSKLEGELLNIRLDHLLVENWAKRSVIYLEQRLQELRELVAKYPFQKRSEEIWFFKEVKAVVMGKMVFMCEAHSIDAMQPFDKAAIKDHLADGVDRVDAFFQRHQRWYEYHKANEDHLDYRLFVRKLDDPFAHRDLPFEIDPVYYYGEPGFSTGFDYLFAQFRGYEQLRDHLENELEAQLMVGDEVPPEEIKFTGSQADFVQMVEIFKAVGRPEDPETGEPATDEQVFQMLKGMFNPDLPNGVDFDTLRNITGSSDLAERMADSLDRLSNEWRDEEKDIDYKKNNDSEESNADDPDGQRPKK